MLSKSLDTFVGLLNFWPGLKTKVSAVGAFGLAVVAAWNSMVPELGYGPCELTAEMLAAGIKSCGGPDLTIKIPDLLNAALFALLAAGAANQPKNLKKEPV